MPRGDAAVQTQECTHVSKQLLAVHGAALPRLQSSYLDWERERSDRVAAASPAAGVFGNVLKLGIQTILLCCGHVSDLFWSNLSFLFLLNLHLAAPVRSYGRADIM